MEHSLRPELRGHLEAFARLVTFWAPRLDLVSPGDLGRLWERHILDSLRALPAVTAARPGPCADVGSGGGFPGIPLALASARPWRLIEPRQKRAAFLEEVIRELGLDTCEVIAITAQAAATDGGLAGSHAVVTARALAPPPEAVARCRPLAAPGGAIVLFVGAEAEIPPEAEEIGPGLIRISQDDRPPGDSW